jgi:hypothetical protein
VIVTPLTTGGIAMAKPAMYVPEASEVWKMQRRKAPGHLKVPRERYQPSPFQQSGVEKIPL